MEGYEDLSEAWGSVTQRNEQEWPVGGDVTVA